VQESSTEKVVKGYRVKVEYDTFASDGTTKNTGKYREG
jgi:hypothetical protein